MNRIYTLLCLAFPFGATNAQTLFYEGFDDVSGLSSAGWVLMNHSEPLGPTSWAQADGTLGAVAYSGDTLSYAQSAYTATDPNGTGTISDWMISPAVTMQDGDVIRLFTLSYNSSTFPDRIEVRISTNGGSDIGTASGDVGDFTTLVFSVNPNLDTTSYPSVASGDTWEEFMGTVSGLGAPTSCRVAVRYYVPDAGGLGSNSSTVGVDDLEVYRGSSSVGIDEADLTTVAIAPNPFTDRVVVNTGGQQTTLTVFDPTGRVVLQQRAAGNHQVDLGSQPAGVYVFEVVETANGAVTRQRVVKH